MKSHPILLFFFITMNVEPHLVPRLIHEEGEGGVCCSHFTFNLLLLVPQLLQLVTVSEKRWRARSRGGGAHGWSDDGEEGFESGDCDDEDECAGVSGLGPPPRRKRLRIFAGETNVLNLTLKFNSCDTNKVLHPNSYR